MRGVSLEAFCIFVSSSGSNSRTVFWLFFSLGVEQNSCSWDGGIILTSLVTEDVCEMALGTADTASEEQVCEMTWGTVDTTSEENICGMAWGTVDTTSVEDICGMAWGTADTYFDEQVCGILLGTAEATSENDIFSVMKEEISGFWADTSADGDEMSSLTTKVVSGMVDTVSDTATSMSGEV